MMKDIDLSGVDPLRRREARRRVEILNRFLAIDSPTTADAARHAEEIGIGVPQFYRLAKAWRIHRDPGSVGAGKVGTRRTRRDGIDPLAKSIVSAVIADVGADAPHEEISIEVVRRCEAAGVRPPSRGVLWTYVMDCRATSPINTGQPRRVVLGRVWAKLPTRHAEDEIFPEMVLALLLPDRLILGTDISCNPARKASASLALARAFASMSTNFSPVEVLVEAGDADEVAPVHLGRLGTMPQPYKASVSRLLSANLGRRIGGLGLLYRQHTAKTGRLLSARSTSAIECELAIAEIERSVLAHNEVLTNAARVVKA